MPVDDVRLDRIVKAYDVRGLVGTELDAEIAHALGMAAGELLTVEGRPFVVGRDMRPSSTELAAAFGDGVRSRGVDVTDIGLASTDMLYYASGIFDAPGVMVTASHNPGAYNGMKFCRASAVPVGIDTGLRELAQRALTVGAGRGTRGRRTEVDIKPQFAAHVRGFVDGTTFTGQRIAVDAGNGMGGLVWPLVTEALDIVTTPLYFELDGTFPHHPADPLDPRNLVDLQQAVRRAPHAAGLAFDGDADRVFVIDEEARAVTASVVGAIVAERMLERHPGSTVLHNLVCSRIVPECIRDAGGHPERTRVGHSFIKEHMARTDAVMGIEHSGHYYFRDNFRADSGIIAALMLLEAVAVAGTGLAHLAAGYQRYASSGERNFVVADIPRALARVAEAFASRGTSDYDDGLTVVCAEGWFNLRPSNTEGMLRLNVEGDDEPTMHTILAQVRAVLDDCGAVGADEGVGG